MPWMSAPVQLTKPQRIELKKVLKSSKTDPKEKMRASIILLCDEGAKNKEIAKRLGIHENTVVKWRGRWKEGKRDAKVADYGELTGRPRTVLTPGLLKKIAKKAQSQPPKGQNRWTVRSMAYAVDIRVATCQRALKELNIKLTESR